MSSHDDNKNDRSDANLKGGISLTGYSLQSFKHPNFILSLVLKSFKGFDCLHCVVCVNYY